MLFLKKGAGRSKGSCNALYKQSWNHRRFNIIVDDSCIRSVSTSNMYEMWPKLKKKIHSNYWCYCSKKNISRGHHRLWIVWRRLYSSFGYVLKLFILSTTTKFFFKKKLILHLDLWKLEEKNRKLFFIVRNKIES